LFSCCRCALVIVLSSLTSCEARIRQVRRHFPSSGRHLWKTVRDMVTGGAHTFQDQPKSALVDSIRPSHFSDQAVGGSIMRGAEGFSTDPGEASFPPCGSKLNTFNTEFHGVLAAFYLTEKSPTSASFVPLHREE